MEQHFVNTFAKFKQEEDKFESLYIFVIRTMTVEATLNEVKRMIAIADEIKNNVKKNYIKARLYSFVTFLDGTELQTNLSGIYMVYKKIQEITIHPEWNETLNMFKCKNFVCEYGDKFKLDWLHNYLTDKSYLNVIQIQNNNIKHIYLNQTKRVVHSEQEEKKCDLNEFIGKHISKGEYCVVHGVSSFIKQLKDSAYMKVLNGNKRDEEILQEFDKLLNEKKSAELQKWLDTMSNSDSKDAKKLAFGKDIRKAINDQMLKTLFCTPRMKKQVIEQLQQDDLIFDIIEVKSYNSTDVGMRLRKDFDGAVGIKFY